jgi:DNA-binding transcriptional LysR family regulator
VELVIGAPPTLYNGLLPDLLDAWSHWHPDVTVSPLMGEDGEVARWLAEGDADMAVLVDPDPVPEGALLLLKDDFRYALASVHPLAAAPGLRPADLDDDVHRLSDGGVERYLRELHERSDRPYVEPPRVREFKTLLDMVAKNQAVGLVPGFARRMLPPGVVLAPTEPKVYRRLYLTGPGNRPWLPVVRDLIANAAELLPDYVSNGEDADGSPVWR